MACTSFTYQVSWLCWLFRSRSLNNLVCGGWWEPVCCVSSDAVTMVLALFAALGSTVSTYKAGDKLFLSAQSQNGCRAFSSPFQGMCLAQCHLRPDPGVSGVVLFCLPFCAVCVSELCSLPYFVSCCSEGPTSYFRISGVRLAQEMHGAATMTTHLPELLLNNFTTRLGRRVARQLAALFPLVRSRETLTGHFLSSFGMVLKLGLPLFIRVRFSLRWAAYARLVRRSTPSAGPAELCTLPAGRPVSREQNRID